MKIEIRALKEFFHSRNPGPVTYEEMRLVLSDLSDTIISNNSGLVLESPIEVIEGDVKNWISSSLKGQAVYEKDGKYHVLHVHCFSDIDRGHVIIDEQSNKYGLEGLTVKELNQVTEEIADITRNIIGKGMGGYN